MTVGEMAIKKVLAIIFPVVAVNPCLVSCFLLCQMAIVARLWARLGEMLVKVQSFSPDT